MSETLRLIHARRLELGIRDQEFHREDLEHLAQQLSSASIDHPFCSEAALVMKNEPAYTNADTRKPRGPSIKLLSQDGGAKAQYLYRLHPVAGVSWLPFLSSSLVTSKRIMGRLEIDSRTRASVWLPLEDYAEGIICNHRSFSWWTTLEPSQGRMVEWSYELGLIKAYLSPSMLLFRLSISRVDDLALAHVPSALDGFDSAVFKASLYEPSVRAGNAISLREFPNYLGDGADEYTLSPIPVMELSFMPIRSFISVHKVDLCSKLLDLLLAYYRNL